jgi:hypothetical protein
MSHRRRFEQTKSLQDRLSEFAADARRKAGELPDSAARDELLKKAHQADTAARLDGWVNSSGLQPPKQPA